MQVHGKEGGPAVHPANAHAEVGQDHPLAIIGGIADHIAAAPVEAGLTADGHRQSTASIFRPVLQQMLAGCAVLLHCQEN